MSGLGFFEIFAECAIAFAGLGAIHAAFRGTTGPRGVMRAFWVVAQGALAFVLSVVPMLLALTALPEELCWRWASGIGLGACLAMIYSLVLLDLRLTRQGHPPQAPLIIRSAQALLIIANASMLSNLLGWPWAPGPLLYAIALTCVLTAGLSALLHSFLVPLQLVFSGNDDATSDRSIDD
jgi:hypothetical protein